MILGISWTRSVGTVIGAIAALAIYLGVLVPQGQTSFGDFFYEEGLLVYALGGMSLISLIGIPGDLFYLCALYNNLDTSADNVEKWANIFNIVSKVSLYGNLAFLALWSFLFIVGGPFFVVLYFVMAGFLFLVPNGL